MNLLTTWRAAVGRAIVTIALPVAVLLGGCYATPLPTPPSARAELMSLDGGQPMRLAFTGRPGAISHGLVTLRITTTSTSVTTPVAADGSFSAMLAGSRTDIFWLELLFPSRDSFVGAFTGMAMTTEVLDADPGANTDSDESPDAIDCAAMDPSLHGRRCPMACSLPELCGDDMDSDCDGSVDEGCGGGACVDDVDCGVREICCMGTCVDPLSDPMHCGLCGAPCAMGMICMGGVCGGGCDPATPEICGDGIDNDCDGSTDEMTEPEICGDRIDNDCDGLADEPPC